MTEQELYILMTLIPGLGSVTQNKLLDIFGGIKECMGQKAEMAATVGLREARDLRMYNRAINAFFKWKDAPALAKRAKEIAEDCQRLGIRVITREDPDYPLRFKGIPELPILLYAKGTLKINDYPRSLGIVGARRCSREGKEKAIAVAEKESASGCAIISGMAKGIDSYAHTACIKKGGYTIAVLGNGPDICYPKEHRSLYDAIAVAGCILSEYPPGTTPRPYNFPLRNRMIAALSDELYVADAGAKSGTTSTVHFFDQIHKLAPVKS